MGLLYDQPARLMIPPASDRRFGDRLVAALSAAGLRGRGGAAFPTATKIGAALGTRSHRRPELIINACDGEPEVRKDEVLLLLLAWSGRRRRGARCSRGRCLGGDLRGASRLAVRGHAAYAHCSGTDAGRCFRPGRPPSLRVQRGLLAGIPGIRRRGASAVPGGASDQPGSRRRAGSRPERRDGRAGRPDLERSAGGEPAGDGNRRGGLPGRPRGARRLDRRRHRPARGRLHRTARAVLLGGYGGSWVSWPDAQQQTLAGLAAAGVPIGAGLISVLGQGCPVAAVGRVLRYLAAESAGQCGPCMFGLPAIADDWRELGHPRLAPAARDRLHRRLPVIAGRGACKHPDGAIRQAVSALQVFADHLEHHGGGRCSSELDLMGAS